MFNEHQQRLWRGMVEHIDSYLRDEIDFYNLVGELEGALDASEIKDNTIKQKWYELWTPLEIVRATNGNNVNQNEIKIELTQMRQFLVDTIFLNCKKYSD